MRAVDLTGPLSILQAREANEEGTRKILETINSKLGGATIPHEQLRETFEMWWPKLRPDLEKGKEAAGADHATPPRKAEDMLAKVLELARAQERREIELENVRAIGRALAQPDLIADLNTRKALRTIGRLAEGVTVSSEMSEIIGGNLELKGELGTVRARGGGGKKDESR